MFAFKVGAQEQGGGVADRHFFVTPRISLTETYSNNVNLSNTNKQSDLTTEISPGIRIASNYGRLKGTIDYSLTQVLYAKNSDKNQLQNALNANGTYEAIDNFAFVDFNGVISQQSISAFGAQSPDNTSINSNRTEVATYRVSPYIKGRLASLADYELRYNYEISKSKSSAASDVERREAMFRLNGDSSFSLLRWSANLNHEEVDYTIGRATNSDRARLNLTYVFNPQFDMTLIGGWENNNYTTLEKQAHTSQGLGANWRPSDATRVSGEIEQRYFGDTHSFTVEHRTPRTAWTYTDNKSVSTSTNPSTLVGLGGLYDLLFSQFATVEPDPIRRAQLVNAFLQTNGLNPNTNVVGSFASSSLLLQRSQALTFALLGIRDTITFSFNRNNSQSLTTLGSGNDDFANNNAIRQTGFTVSYSHRLTPDASLNVLLTQQRSAGVTNSLSTKTRAVNANLSSKVTEKIYTNLGVRHTISDGNATSSYKETAVTGSVNVQF